MGSAPSAMELCKRRLLKNIQFEEINANVQSAMKQSMFVALLDAMTTQREPTLMIKSYVQTAHQRLSALLRLRQKQP